MIKHCVVVLFLMSLALVGIAQEKIEEELIIFV